MPKKTDKYYYYSTIISFMEYVHLKEIIDTKFNKKKTIKMRNLTKKR